MLSFFWGLNLYAQTKPELKIQYIEIKDPFIIKEIEKLILEEVNRERDTTTNKVYTENLFKNGLGYINLTINSNFKGDTICRYYISPSLVSIKEEQADDVYPPFYTNIGGRLILIYSSELEFLSNGSYTEKSKKMLRKKLEPFLERVKDVTFYDMQGKKAFRDKKMRKDYFQFHNGKYIYILKNKSPIVVKDQL